MYLEEGVGRAGTAACDLNSHDYLYIQGGRDGSDGQPGGSFSEPTEEKFCGRSLSGLAVTETADRMRSGYVLDPPDNNTVASTVTSKFITIHEDTFWRIFHSVHIYHKFHECLKELRIRDVKWSKCICT